MANKANGNHSPHSKKDSGLGFPGAPVVKNLPAVLKTWVPFLGTEIPCRKEWLPAPIFSSREFHGQRNLAGCTVCGIIVRYNLATNT